MTELLLGAGVVALLDLLAWSHWKGEPRGGRAVGVHALGLVTSILLQVPTVLLSDWRLPLRWVLVALGLGVSAAGLFVSIQTFPKSWRIGLVGTLGFGLVLGFVGYVYLISTINFTRLG